MQLIDKFHKMELDYRLFQLGGKHDLPIWDIIRYDVYLKYLYPIKGLEKLAKKQKRFFGNPLSLIKVFFSFIIRFIFTKGSNIILTSSRYVNSNGEAFDKSGKPIIDALEKDILILEPSLHAKSAYPICYDFSILFRKIYRSKNITESDYNKIKIALTNSFGKVNITLDEVNHIYHRFQSDSLFYRYFFFIKRTKRLYICQGNPKAQVFAAKINNIETFLVQHGRLEYDEIHCSYPSTINLEDNILFPDNLFTLGNYWGKNMNIPVKNIFPIGNDYFYQKPIAKEDGSILMISTIIHGLEMKKLTKDLAKGSPDLAITYKLHPNEFDFYDEYITYFSETKNVSVLTNEIDTNILISKARLVIIIISTVLYEALNQCKKVGVYKKMNYQNPDYLKNVPNLYFFNTVSELIKLLDKEPIDSNMSFYKPNDMQMINNLLHQ